MSLLPVKTIIKMDCGTKENQDYTTVALESLNEVELQLQSLDVKSCSTEMLFRFVFVLMKD